MSPRGWAFLLLAALPGCGRSPAPPPDSPARQAVRTFCEGLLHQDWQQAYAVLDPDSQNRVPLEEFVRRAQEQRRGLGFEPEEVHIRTCSEQGTEGVARVIWTGRQDGRTRRRNDGLVLRQSEASWRVVLGEDFGFGGAGG